MAPGKMEALKQEIGFALRSDNFQKTLQGVSEAGLPAAVVQMFKRRSIRVVLISVEPANKASLADFAVVWQIPAGKQGTNWLSLRHR